MKVVSRGLAVRIILGFLLCSGNFALIAETYPKKPYPYYPYYPYPPSTYPRFGYPPDPVPAKQTPSPEKKPVPPVPEKKVPAPPPPKEEPLGLPKASGTAPVAPLYPVCGNNFKTRLWAQLFVDADLMQAEIARLKLPKGHTNVAVLDTGFDVKGNGANLASTTFAAKPGFKEAGPHEEDKDGHGTMVAGVIGGKNGLGVAPDVSLTVYRVTGPAGGGSTSPKNLEAAAKQACEDGNTIINMSWGGVYDETGQERSEVSDKKLIEWLTSRGCLLVKSAGNSAYRADYASNLLDDGYLRVAAVVGSGTLSPFSTKGEVQAPGSYVFTLQSKTSGAEPATENAKLCGGSEGRFVNGTSFASPITAAVAAEVSGVLSTLDPIGFDHLGPEKRIKLINRILKASEHKGSISGLRAVLIAERWAKTLEREAPTPEQLAALLEGEPPSFCAEPADLTLDPKKPELFVALARKRLAVCPAYKDDKRMALRLVAAFVRGHNLELALRWLAPFDEEFWKMNPKGGRELADYLGHFLDRKWRANNTYASITFGVDFDESMTFLPIYLATRGIDSTGIKETEEAMSAFLGSWDLRERLSRRPLRGSEEDFAGLRIVWKLASEKMGSKRFLAFLEKYAMGTIDKGTYSRPNSREVLIAFRILSEMIADPYFKAQQTDLEKIEWELFTKTNATNKFELEKNADEKTDLIYLVVWGTDINHFHVRYLDSFVKRHWKKISELTGLARYDFDATKLGPFFTAYFLKADLDLAVEWKAEWKAYLGLKTLETIGRHEGWNDFDEAWYRNSREDSKFAGYALDAVLEGYKTTKLPAWKKWIGDEYRRIFSQAKNFDFFASQLKSSGSQWSISRYLWEWTFERNPLMTKELAHNAAIRVFYAIPHLSAEVRKREGMAIAEAIDALAPFLVAPEFLIADLMLPTLASAFRYTNVESFDIKDAGASRLKAAAGGMAATTTRQVEPGTLIPWLAENALDSWASWMVTLKKEDRDNYGLSRVLKAFHENRPLCQVLGKTGAWRKSVAELGRMADGSYSAFGSSNFDVKWASMRLLKNCE